MDYIEQVRQLTDPILAEELTALRGLGGVMGWMTQHGLSLSAVKIVQQDEFSLDFLVPLDDDRTLVFGIT